ncbi:D-2-hydroxyacid dehydrogenase [Streptomyces sp. NPDC052042]|uniref:D-2-hydroxyacid dehydrogenase n=1 Tax=Streptomyces sp. NPDC052042 TaxID=3365683 RepID=UPI0037CE3FA7
MNSRSTRPVITVLTGGLLEQKPNLSSLAAEADVRIANSAAELAETLPGSEVLLVWDYRFADIGPLIPQTPSLCWIHAASVGVDPLLSPQLSEADQVVLTNSRGVFDVAIAEYVAMLLLARVKRFAETLTLQSKKQWKHRMTANLTNRTVAVVGTGSIGRRIATLLKNLGMDVRLVGRRGFQDDDFGEVPAVTRLSTLAHEVDFLVLAAPMTEQNRHMVDADVLAALGPNGYLVNIGRGGLIDTKALEAALTAGTLGGAALDVFDEEPLPVQSMLWSHPEVTVSPHMSGDFEGYDTALVEAFAENFGRWRRGEPLRNVVDTERGYVASGHSL